MSKQPGADSIECVAMQNLVLDAKLWSAYTASDVGWLQKRRCPSLSIRKVYLDTTDSSSLCDALDKYAEVVFI